MTPKEQIFKMIEGRIDTASNLLIECFEFIYKAGYNEAMEEAAKMTENSGYAEQIRKLMK